MNSRWLRNGFIYLLILVAVVAIVYSFFGRSSSTKSEPVSQIVADAKAGEVKEIVVDGDSLTVKYLTGEEVKSRKEKGSSITTLVSDKDGNLPKGLSITAKQGSSFGNWAGILISFLPLVLFGGLIFFFMRQAQGSNAQAMNFGKSRARAFTGNRPSVTFADVAGVDEAKEELQEVVEFLKYPEKFAALEIGRAHV